MDLDADVRTPVRTTDAMTRLADDALALQSIAERLHDDRLEHACAPLVPAALTAVEHTLRVLAYRS